MAVFQTVGEMDRTSIGRCALPREVPPGKRLVIETVTGWYYGDGEVLGAALLNAGWHGDIYMRYAFPWVQCGSLGQSVTDRKFHGFNHLVRIYVEGRATLMFDAYGGAGTGSGSYSGGYSISGYLEDLPRA